MEPTVAALLGLAEETSEEVVMTAWIEASVKARKPCWRLGYESAYGGYRGWARSLQGRMLMAVAVVVVLAGTGTPIGAALGLGAVAAVGGLVMYAISSRRTH